MEKIDIFDDEKESFMEAGFGRLLREQENTL